MTATELVDSGEISSETRLSNIGMRNFLQEVVEQCKRISEIYLLAGLCKNPQIDILAKASPFLTS